MYRYAMTIHGINYAEPELDNPSSVIMIGSLDHARRVLFNAASGNPYAVNGDGERVLDTPGYGEPGDYARLWVVPVSDPEYSLPIDTEGARARHAYAWMIDYNSDFGVLHDLSPEYQFEFGPRGGLKLERF